MRAAGRLAAKPQNLVGVQIIGHHTRMRFRIQVPKRTASGCKQRAVRTNGICAIPPAVNGSHPLEEGID